MALRDELMAIYEREGELTPELVVAEARPETSPLHPLIFDADPGEAAERYYLERARRVIQRVHVTITVHQEETREVRWWHAVPGTARRYEFVPLPEIQAEPDKFLAAMTEARRRVAEAQDSVDDLAAIAADTPFAERTKRASGAIAIASAELTE